MPYKARARHCRIDRVLVMDKVQTYQVSIKGWNHDSAHIRAQPQHSREAPRVLNATHPKGAFSYGAPTAGGHAPVRGEDKAPLAIPSVPSIPSIPDVVAHLTSAASGTAASSKGRLSLSWKVGKVKKFRVIAPSSQQTGEMASEPIASIASAPTLASPANAPSASSTRATKHYTTSRLPAKLFPCPKPGCTKRYNDKNGVKKHLETGSCETAPRPYRCRVPACQKDYKNANGLKYHYKHAHVWAEHLRIASGRQIAMQSQPSPGPSSSASLAESAEEDSPEEEDNDLELETMQERGDGQAVGSAH